MTSAAGVEMLSAAQAEEALRLSILAGWNQTERDWRYMLTAGRGFAIRDPGGLLIATALILPYGPAFSWISMVLVDPACRRRGLAKLLMDCAVGEVLQSGGLPVLDATPAGQLVYRGIGFHDTWGFARWKVRRLAVEDAARSTSVRPLRDDDWGQVLALDARAFGSDRAGLLRWMAAAGEPACVGEADGRIGGFAFSRRGVRFPQIGPVIADDADLARDLIACAAAQLAPADAFYLDLCDRRTALQDWLRAAEAERERPFLRMVFGAPIEFGTPSLIAAVAGPELG